MDLKEAMSLRHTVRKFQDKEVNSLINEQIKKRINENNDKYQLNMELVFNNKSPINWLGKLLFHPTNCHHYILLLAKLEGDYQYRLGYSAADLMLYIQTLGLNTWFIGGTYKKSIFKNNEQLKLVGIIVFGYGINSGVAHKSKSINEVSKYSSDNVPLWFNEGVKAALLAPTALNKQDFYIEGDQNIVKITSTKQGMFSEVDRGLAAYHFELGASKENFKWKE